MKPLFRAASLVALIFGALIALSGEQARAETVVASAGQTVTTGTEGKQILFRDKTSVTVGEGSSVTVKRANYDTQTGGGNVVIEVTKGAFRYVTGDHAGSHTVKTPLSTVGVRGTVIEGYVDVNGYEIFVLVEGAFEVCTAVGCQQVTTPGTFVVVSPNGAISPPQPLTTTLQNAMLLTFPSVNLIQQHFSELITSGSDPLVRFRDMNEGLGNTAPLPPEYSCTPPYCGD